jgi:excinuclease ABC subunit A
LQSVGLEFLTLARSQHPFGGESQVRLATQIGSSLMGVLYILDEPRIGLHPRVTIDYRHPQGAARPWHHPDCGEQREVTMYAPTTCRIGPAAGVHGGEVYCAGTLAK